jgi:hypothetical protein
MSAERSNSLIVVASRGIDGEANAGGRGVGGLAEAHRLLERSGDALGDRRAVGLEAVVARDHEEFVTAHAHHEVGAGDGVAQSARDRAQIVVADRVTARIVDVLEIVAVDVEDRQRIAAPRGLVDERGSSSLRKVRLGSP